MTGFEQPTISALQRDIAQRLKAGEISNPGLEARFLLAHILNFEPGELIAKSLELVSAKDQQDALKLVEQRLGGVPLHRLFGYRDFFGSRIEFGEGCLEPRPETELLVERILADYQSTQRVQFAEIGVGSGAIIASLLQKLPLASAIGTDISTKALEWAKYNGEKFGVWQRFELVETNCLDGIDGKFDFIVSNPPYIPTTEIESLSSQVREHDPAAALDGGADGFKIYRKILDTISSKLKVNGKLYLETGHGQHRDLITIAVEKGWGIVSTHLDLSGLERIVVLERK